MSYSSGISYKRTHVPLKTRMLLAGKNFLTAAFWTFVGLFCLLLIIILVLVVGFLLVSLAHKVQPFLESVPAIICLPILLVMVIGGGYFIGVEIRNSFKNTR